MPLHRHRAARLLRRRTAVAKADVARLNRISPYGLPAGAGNSTTGTVGTNFQSAGLRMALEHKHTTARVGQRRRSGEPTDA